MALDLLRYLFVDMNAYFASVEQQDHPHLRGRPVGVAPVLTESTCCIAVSYEARAHGVKTGTGVGEARRLCPGIRIVEARPARYVEVHHRVMEVIESCVPIEHIHSIDEAACRLIGDEREPDNALAIAHRIKQRLAQRIGPFVRCTVGLGPNRLLAKAATKLQKPDGLVLIRPSDIPDVLSRFKLDDLPGVGRKMLVRLHVAGITSVPQFYALTQSQQIAVWHSVFGRYWWHWLRGHDIDLPTTHRRTVSHSHVMAPEFRTEQGARRVLVRLIHKAAMRLRRLGYWARELDVGLRAANGRWSDAIRFHPAQDTQTFLEAFRVMWNRKPPLVTPKHAWMVLTHLLPPQSATLPLFEHDRNRLQLSAALDRINTRYGAHSIYFGSMYGAQTSAPMRISFTQIPDPALPA